RTERKPGFVEAVHIGAAEDGNPCKLRVDGGEEVADSEANRQSRQGCCQTRGNRLCPWLQRRTSRSLDGEGHCNSIRRERADSCCPRLSQERDGRWGEQGAVRRSRSRLEAV